MKSFTTAAQAEPLASKTEAAHLRNLCMAIHVAIHTPAEEQIIFKTHGLDRETLQTHSHWLEDAIATPHAHGILDAHDIDFITPFISGLGHAYSDLMEHSLSANTTIKAPASIEQASKLHDTLNFFHAQKAKLHSTISPERALRNE